MKPIIGLIMGLTFLYSKGAAQQKVVAECTVNFQIILTETKVDKDVQNAIQQSSKTVYIKGNDSRVDLISPTLTQSVIYDKSNGTAVVLKEFGNNKFMTRLSQTAWKLANKQYEGLNIQQLSGTKTILGYECKKVLISLKDSTVFNVYYATAITPSVKEFEYQFKDIPGFVLEFQEKETDGTVVTYKAIKITLSPVLASKYDVPTSGYRLLN